jgi:hypothetical protein
MTHPTPAFARLARRHGLLLRLLALHGLTVAEQDEMALVTLQMRLAWQDEAKGRVRTG